MVRRWHPRLVEVLVAPRSERQQHRGGGRGLSKSGGTRIVTWSRPYSLGEAGPLEAAQTVGEDVGRDPLRRPLELTEPGLAVEQVAHDQQGSRGSEGSMKLKLLVVPTVMAAGRAMTLVFIGRARDGGAGDPPDVWLMPLFGDAVIGLAAIVVALLIWKCRPRPRG